MRQGVDFILEALSEEGLDHLFMVPGGLVDPFLPALGRQTALTPIVAAQEGGAAYMADGYARASGNLGVALCIGGPGLANAVTAIATARTDGSPLLLLSGEVSTSLEGRGMFQDASPQTLDDVSMLKPIARYSSSIDNPKNLPHLFKRAMLQLRTQPSAPVHLSLPGDCLTGQLAAEYAAIDPALRRPGTLALTAAEASLRHFDGPTPPIKIAILAGAGVEHAESARALREFAELWRIPVATTLRGKGVFPEDHPLSLGVFGYAGTHHARSALLGAPLDLLIVLGTGLNERDTMHWALQIEPSVAINVNLSAVSLGMHAQAGAVVGDCGAYLKFLLDRGEALHGSLAPTLEARAQWLSEIRSTPRLQDAANCASDATPLHPARVISELRKLFPRDGVLLVDSGAHRAFAGHYWESYEPRTYISATNLGPMGWAIAAATGVQCASPTRRVAVITGDGCMRMSGMEVATAARYRLPLSLIHI